MDKQNIKTPLNIDKDSIRVNNTGDRKKRKKYIDQLFSKTFIKKYFSNL